MPVTYKLWIVIEKCDDDNETYENVELHEAFLLGSRETLDEAIELAKDYDKFAESGGL